MSDKLNQAPSNLLPASAQAEPSEDIQGMRALLSRLYREIGVAAVAAELNIQPSGPRITRRPAVVRESTPAKTSPQNASRAA